MKRSIVLGAAFSCILSFMCAGASAQVINELDVNPGGTDGPCEYIELRGTPGSIIENVYFVGFEGDSGTAGPGTADNVVTFAAPGVAFPSNGLIVITGTQACGTRTYPAETLRLQAAFLDTSAGGIENGTISFLLISSPVAITVGTDYDADNNGTLEGLPAGAVILDSIAWTDGGAGDITYGNVVLTAFGGNIGAATRFPGDLRPNTPAAWYAGILTGNPDALTYGTARTPNFPANGALTPGAPNVGVPVPDAPVDINGDARSDYIVVRAAGGAGSQLTWLQMIDDGNPTSSREWGISGDQILMGDYDGDGRDDVTVFRPSNGTFYIIQSGTLTMRIEQFGQNGDNARVVGDYDGDGRDDLAVYRPGSPSVWYYKTSPTALFVDVEWGEAGDTPAPGDYDGDGRADFVVRRASGANGVFWKLFASGGIATEPFGLATDLVVPGDYDDDGKTDVSVVRTSTSPYTWLFEPSGTAGSTIVSDTWGVTGDVITPGDYDGDGRSDYAVWRPGNPGNFWVMTVGDRIITVQPWGQTGDYPAANYNVFQ